MEDFRMKKKNVLILLGALVLLVSPVFAQTWRVDDSGNITLDGQVFRIKGGSWFGLEGRHEPPDDPNNPSGAPMEMYIGNVWWQPSNRTYQGDADEFASMGLNTVRLPLVHQTLDNSDPQGRQPFLKNNQSVIIMAPGRHSRRLSGFVTMPACMSSWTSTPVTTG
jgi:aryl-phospho-beta-D-glucosidase BglC (GH1 family)